MKFPKKRHLGFHFFKSAQKPKTVDNPVDKYGKLFGGIDFSGFSHVDKSAVETVETVDNSNFRFKNATKMQAGLTAFPPDFSENRLICPGSIKFVCLKLPRKKLSPNCYRLIPRVIHRFLAFEPLISQRFEGLSTVSTAPTTTTIYIYIIIIIIRELLILSVRTFLRKR